MPTNCVSVFDHSVGLALRRLIIFWVNVVTRALVSFTTSMYSGQKKGSLLFGNRPPEKSFITLPRPHSGMCIGTYIFCLKKHKQKANKLKKIKEKNKRKQRRKGERKCCCYEQYLWKIQRDIISFVNLLWVLLTYVIESWISPGCSCEFNVVYLQREKSQYLLYYINISTHFQERK